jgi:hypothetical protein
MDFNSTGYRSVKPCFAETKGNNANNMDSELSKTDTPTANLHTMYIQPFRRPYGSVVLFHFCQFDGKRVISSLPSGQPLRAVIGSGGLQRGLMPKRLLIWISANFEFAAIEQKLCIMSVGQLSLLENELLSFPFFNNLAGTATCLL